MADFRMDYDEYQFSIGMVWHRGSTVLYNGICDVKHIFGRCGVALQEKK